MNAVHGGEVGIPFHGCRAAEQTVGIGVVARRVRVVGSAIGVVGPDRMHQALEVGHARVVAVLDVERARRRRRPAGAGGRAVAGLRVRATGRGRDERRCRAGGRGHGAELLHGVVRRRVPRALVPAHGDVAGEDVARDAGQELAAHGQGRIVVDADGRAPSPTIVVREAHHDVRVVALVDDLVGVDHVEAAEVRAGRERVVGEARFCVDAPRVLGGDEVEEPNVGSRRRHERPEVARAETVGVRVDPDRLGALAGPPCVSHACTTTPDGAMAMSPKLHPPVVPGLDCIAPKAPMPAGPSPVTAAPRARIWPLWFQTIQTATGAPGAVVFAATMVGWSTLAGPNVVRFANVAPLSVLRRVMMFVPPIDVGDVQVAERVPGERGVATGRRPLPGVAVGDRLVRGVGIDPGRAPIRAARGEEAWARVVARCEELELVARVLDDGALVLVVRHLGGVAVVPPASWAAAGEPASSSAAAGPIREHRRAE